MKYLFIAFLLLVATNSFSQISNSEDQASISNMTAADSMAADMEDTTFEYELLYGKSELYIPENYTNSESIDLNIIVGDYWSRNPISDLLPSAQSDDLLSDLYYAYYNFHNNSSFHSERGYLGDRNENRGFTGEYQLSEDSKSVYLYANSSYGTNNNASWDEDETLLGMKLLNVSDSMVTFLPINFQGHLGSKTISMYRYPGCLKNQLWTWNDSDDDEYNLVMNNKGNFEYWVTKSGGNSNIKRYVFRGRYHFHDNVVYMGITNLETEYTDENRENDVINYRQEQPTYIRVDLDKGVINGSDLVNLNKGIIVYQNWAYHNGHYQTANPIEESKEEEWIQIEGIAKDN